MYAEILKNLRLKNNLLQKDMAKILGISEITYTHYESECFIMPMKYLISICNYFHVYMDYLFGFGKEHEKIYNNITLDKVLIGKKLKEWRKENKITQMELAKILKTNQSSIAMYERGSNLVSTFYLYAICKTYKVSADYLLGRIDKNTLK